MAEVERLPDLPDQVKTVVSVAVNQSHYDSSDEEFDNDRNFRQTSQNLTQSLIDDLSKE